MSILDQLYLFIVSRSEPSLLKMLMSPSGWGWAAEEGDAGEEGWGAGQVRSWHWTAEVLSWAT